MTSRLDPPLDLGKMAPYGAWDSPITADTIVGKDNIVFSDALVDPVTQIIYHIEERPKDNGRCVIVDTKANEDVLPFPYSARTFVQEYGGAPGIIHDNVIYFSNDSGGSQNRDNAIYALRIGDQDAKRVTPENKFFRYADFALHPKQTNLLVVVREDHTKNADGTHPEMVINAICFVNVNTTKVTSIIEGAGFHATPVLNPSGDKLAWQRWDLPNMPWQNSLLYFTTITVDTETLTISDHILIEGGKNEPLCATFPLWINDTTLAYITDKHNKYQNPYIYHTDTKESSAILKTPLEQDFAEPAWRLGLYPYAILENGKCGVFTAFKDGGNILYLIDLSAPSDPIQINWDFTVAQHVRMVNKNAFVFTGSKTSSPGGVVEGKVTIDWHNYYVALKILKFSTAPNSPLLRYVSKPDQMKLTEPGGNSIHVIRYDPYNPHYSGSPFAERPPCILNVHGGPTRLESQALNWIKMFFTSRGFAWIDVNYRGSSGYGRAYSDLINGHWGQYDVQDCYQVAVTLAANGHIDGNRVAIRGGSAGAYTMLASLTFAPDSIPTFYKSACGSRESFNWTTLGGPPTNQAWDPRNPIKHVDNVKVPLLLLQGQADGVVPPAVFRHFVSQSSRVGPSGQFVLCPNEGPRWRLESTIKNALMREYHWYLDTLL